MRCVAGHQNYNLRLVAGVKPPSSRAGVKTPPLTEVLEELIQRAGAEGSLVESRFSSFVKGIYYLTLQCRLNLCGINSLISLWAGPSDQRS